MKPRMRRESSSKKERKKRVGWADGGMNIKMRYDNDEEIYCEENFSVGGKRMRQRRGKSIRKIILIFFSVSHCRRQDAEWRKSSLRTERTNKNKIKILRNNPPQGRWDEASALISSKTDETTCNLFNRFFSFHWIYPRDDGIQPVRYLVAFIVWTVSNANKSTRI